MTTDDIRKELNQIDEQTHRKLVHYIQTRCCPEDIAEECVQYAYLQALVQAKKIRRSDRLLSWLITVAKRSAWKEMKRRKRLMCAEIGEVKYEEMFENELLMHMDLERILEKQANVWPEYYWQIIRLFYEEEMSLSIVVLGTPKEWNVSRRNFTPTSFFSFLWAAAALW